MAEGLLAAHPTDEALASSIPTTDETRKQEFAEMLGAANTRKLSTSGASASGRSEKPLVVVEVDHVAGVNRVATARTIEARTGVRDLATTRPQMQHGLYTLVPEPPPDPGVLPRIPVTVRSDRELSVGNQIWVQQECWEIVDRHAPLDEAPQRSAFLCATL